jgi:hypothetical protein
MKDHGLSPGGVALLSFMFTGLGQIYNGEIFKAVILMSFACFGIILTLVSAVYLFYSLMFIDSSTMLRMTLAVIVFLLGVIVMIISGIYSIYDAYHAAHAK